MFSLHKQIDNIVHSAIPWNFKSVTLFQEG